MSQVTITHSEIRDHEYLEELLHNFLNPKGKAGFKAQAKVMDKIQLELLQFEKYQCSYFNWAVHKLFGSMIADNFSSPAVGEIEAIQMQTSINHSKVQTHIRTLFSLIFIINQIPRLLNR